MVLTPEGKNLLPYVERLLALAAEACKSIGELKPTGRPRLGAMESTPASRMPSLLASYRREWKAVGIALFVKTRDVLVEHLRALKPMPFSSPVPSRRQIGSCSNTNRSFRRIALVTLHGHPPVQSPADLKLDTMIAFNRGCAYRRLGEK